MGQRLAPARGREVSNSLPGAVGSQALTNSHVSVEHRCLTPAFSGAASGIPMLMRNLLRGLRCNALLGRSRRLCFNYLAFQDK